MSFIGDPDPASPIAHERSEVDESLLQADSTSSASPTIPRSTESKEPSKWIPSEWRYQKLLMDLSEQAESAAGLKSELQLSKKRYVDQRPEHLRPMALHRSNRSLSVGAGNEHSLSISGTASGNISFNLLGQSRQLRGDSTLYSFDNTPNNRSPEVSPSRVRQSVANQSGQYLHCSICQESLRLKPVRSCCAVVECNETLFEGGKVLAIDSNGHVAIRLPENVSAVPAPVSRMRSMRHHYCESCYTMAIAVAVKPSCPLCSRPVSNERNLIAEMIGLDPKAQLKEVSSVAS